MTVKHEEQLNKGVVNEFTIGEMLVMEHVFYCYISNRKTDYLRLENLGKERTKDQQIIFENLNKINETYNKIQNKLMEEMKK